MDVFQGSYAALGSVGTITGTVEEAVMSVLDEADLALLDRTRLGTVDVFSLPRRNKGHHPGDGL